MALESLYTKYADRILNAQRELKRLNPESILISIVNVDGYLWIGMDILQ